jgi:catechol 2,3-dioxygenase-like lactoylglutathione lyase family enzyme
MATVQVRYIVNDVDAAIAFYGQQLGFETVMHPRRHLPCSLGATSGSC